MPRLHEVISGTELNLLYKLQDKGFVQNLLQVEGTPESLRIILLSALRQMAGERGVLYHRKGQETWPVFEYDKWLQWFAGQRGIREKKVRKSKTINVPKNVEIRQPPPPRPPPPVIQPGTIAVEVPRGYRFVVVNGQMFTEEG